MPHVSHSSKENCLSWKGVGNKRGLDGSFASQVLAVKDEGPAVT